jgi:alcohol dehydrogenase (cytochrome c)/quinohemoprotein ethanol dehydrogenase
MAAEAFTQRVTGALARCLPALLLLSHGAWSGTGADRVDDWPHHGRSHSEQRFSPLSQIDTASVGKLSLAWYLDLDTRRGQEATPLVVDGVMYTTTAWSKVVAVDAASGRKLWQFDPEVPGDAAVKACCDVVNRGAAYHDGRVYAASLDGRLFALDARTGKPVWSVMTVDDSKPYTITGAPRVARGKVFIGNGGAEFGVRGYVSAYDARSGELLWRFYTVPGEPGTRDGAASDRPLEALARATWFGDDYWRYGGGGTVWDAIVYDPELNQLYVGVGNGSPWNHRVRSEGKGDNLFLSSVLALDPDTGRYLWHYQETPGESWDFTAAQQMVLTDLELNGRATRVLLHAPKNGFFYVLDRATGKPLSAEKFADANWAERIDLDSGRPVENPAARFVDAPFVATTGAPGAHNWHPMAFHPALGLVYIPVQQIPFLYTHDRKFRFQPGLWNVGISLMADVPRTPEAIAAVRAGIRGSLLAWDPSTQRAAWRVERAQAPNGGVLATAGNLVFQGLGDGTFRAHDARDGRELWRFDAASTILAGPISYRAGGEQFIAVMAGNGGGLGLSLPAFDGPAAPPPGRILAFKLDGRAELPAPPRQASPAVVVTKEEWGEEVQQRGKALYDAICSVCHGMGTLSGGILPDLKRSPLLASAGAWRAVVIDGALTPRGMAGFARHLTPEQAETIRAYVAGEALRYTRPWDASPATDAARHR